VPKNLTRLGLVRLFELFYLSFQLKILISHASLLILTFNIDLYKKTNLWLACYMISNWQLSFHHEKLSFVQKGQILKASDVYPKTSKCHDGKKYVLFVLMLQTVLIFFLTTSQVSLILFCRVKIFKKLEPLDKETAIFCLIL